MWIAFFIYFISSNIVVTFLTIDTPIFVWLTFQPLLVILSLGMAGLTAAAKFRDRDDNER
jgi:hypothetical protein